jgi:cytoskeletal protein CcmA (bactofilin family)
MHNGRGLTIKGDVTASEDVTIDFTVEGTIDVGGGHRLTVAEGGDVQAAVTAQAVVVHGRFDGHISADRLELAPTALVTASVVAPRIALQDGAQLTGPVNTERAQAAASVAKHRQKTTTEA